MDPAKPNAKTLPGIGVFGTDQVVKILVHYLQAKGFRIEALWGLTLQDAQVTAKELSIPFWTNKVDNVLLRKDVELILIFCPPNLHSQIAVKALGIGKHVLCDRIAGLNQTETLKMVLAAQYYPSLICVLNYGLRFHPAFIQMKKNMDKYVGVPKLCQCRIEMGSLLGQTYTWLCDEVMGGGNLTLLGSHLIDMVTYLTNLRAVRVHGLLKTFTTSTGKINGVRRITSPDFALIQMEMEQGMLVSITLTNHMQQGYFCQEVLVCGSKGYLKAEGVTIKGLIYDDINGPGENSKEQKEVIIFQDESDVMDTMKPPESPLLPQIYMTGLLKLVGALREAYLNTWTVLMDREWKRETTVGQLGAGFEDGLYVQGVIEAIRRSSKENAWVKLNILSEEPDPNPVLTAHLKL